MKTITDHELSEIANDWAKEIPYENVGIRTAFTAGYRLAEQQANDADLKNGKLPIPYVIKSVCCDECKKELKPIYLCTDCLKDEMDKKQTVL